MAKNEEVVEVVEFDSNKVYAKLIKDGDGYSVIDEDGTIKECKITEDGQWLILPSNASNRKFMAINKANKMFEECDEIDLYYKATKHIGPSGSKLPNSKLIEYLSEEDRAEYEAIIERAKAAKEADKKKPVTEKEKLEAKLAKAQAALAALEAQAAELGI